MNDHEHEYDIVSLAPDEWDNEFMREVARQHFAQHPECRFVEVREHGGWFLGFRRDLSIWSTANDRAAIVGPRPRKYSGVHVWRGRTDLDVVA